MPNTLTTTSKVTLEALAVLANTPGLIKSVNRQFDPEFAVKGRKIGETLNVRVPQRFTVSTGPSFSAQDQVNATVPVRITSQRHVDMAFGTAEAALSLDNLRDLYVAPAMSQIIAAIEMDIAAALQTGVANYVGVPGTTPSTVTPYLSAKTRLDELGIPLGQRNLIVNPDANTAVVGGLSGLLNPSGVLSEQFKSGSIGSSPWLGFNSVGMSQNLITHTTGSRLATGATVATTVSTQGATTIAITGGGANATITAGDVFTVSGVNQVNHQTRVSTGKLRQFVALQSVTLNASGAGNITVHPMYTSSEVLANQTALPQANAAVVFVGAPSTSIPQNFAFDKQSIVLASCRPEDPSGNTEFSTETHEGFTLRTIMGYNHQTDQNYLRIDALYGVAVVRPEGIVRIAG